MNTVKVKNKYMSSEGKYISFKGMLELPNGTIMEQINSRQNNKSIVMKVSSDKFPCVNLKLGILPFYFHKENGADSITYLTFKILDLKTIKIRK